MPRSPRRRLRPWVLLGCAAAAALAAPAFAQPKAAAPKGPAPNDPLSPEKDPPQVDQARVDAAIAKGAEWLRARVKAGLPIPNAAGPGGGASGPPKYGGSTNNEMVLYALLHAGVDRGDPDLIKLVNDIRSKPPLHIYTGAIRAMALEMYDPVKLRSELAMTAQFLIDNQARNGQWSYGRSIPWPTPIPVIFTPTSVPPRYITTGPQGGPATAPSAPAAAHDVKASGATRNWPDGTPMNKASGTDIKKSPPKQLIPRRNWGSPGDNSNTQYAILGLRACMGQGLLPPQDCLLATEQWLTAQQNEDGGWHYSGEVGQKTSYGSMTAGGVSTLSVCIRGLKNADPRKDPRIQKALGWLSKNLDFGRNPKCEPEHGWHYYWIYAVERAGALAETEWFGDRPWYYEGANWLLGAQGGDGAWGGGDEADSILNTCWAILFLRRATKHIADQKPPVIFTR